MYYLSNLQRCENRQACQCIPTCTSNGQVPVWNSTTNRFDCGSVSGTGSPTLFASFAENYGGALSRYTSIGGAYTSTPIEAENQHIIIDGTFTDLLINVITNSQTLPTTVTLKVNGLATLLTQIIPATTLGQYTISSPIAVNSGDLVSLEASCSDTLAFYAKTTLVFEG